MSSKKRRPKSKGSRSKKTYWRKGVNLNDVEEYLSAQRYDESAGGFISERKDEDLFTIDTKRRDADSKLTRRQQAAVDKRILLTKSMTPSEPKPSKRTLKKLLRIRRNKRPLIPSLAVNCNKLCAEKNVLDIWEEVGEEEKPSASEEYFNWVTKKKLPKKPSTLNHICSILPQVELPHPAISYNPQSYVYESYLEDIAKEEIKHERKEDTLKKNLALSCGESYVTAGEKFLEESSGLFPENEFEFEEENGAGPEMPIEKKLIGRKTRKEIRRRALQRKKDLEKEHEKTRKAEEQLVFSTHKLKREILENLARQEKKAKDRKRNKMLKRLTCPQGKSGRFVDIDRAFLLPEELPGSLRQLSPQGDILKERLKTLQKRNIIPVSGKRNMKKLKRKLKVKEVEKNSSKEVSIGSHMKR